MVNSYMPPTKETGNYFIQSVASSCLHMEVGNDRESQKQIIVPVHDITYKRENLASIIIIW